MSRLWVRILLFVAVATAIGLLLDWLIETDREKIEKLIETCRVAALRGDAEGVMSQVDPAYSHLGRDFAAIRERVAGGLRQFKADKILILDPRLELHEDDTARINLVVRIFRPPQELPLVIDLEVSLGLVKKEKRWYIASVDEGD